MDGKQDAWKGDIRRALQGVLEVKPVERRRNSGRRLTDGVARIGTTLVRAINQARRLVAGDAANDATFQDQSIRARLGAKSSANQCVFGALIRKLKADAARAASPALARLPGLLEELLWSVKMITSPQ